MEVTGLILAGGLSSRFGTDKAEALYCGRTFIRIAYDLLKSTCGEVVISGTDHQMKVHGITCLPDIVPFGGPMAGIATAVSQLTSQWLLIVPCDMPLLTPGIINANIKEARATGRTAVWKDESGKLQPFPMLLNRADAARAIAQLGQPAGLSIKALLQHLPYTAIPIPQDQLQYFGNINTQPEFEELCHRQHQHPASASAVLR